MSDDRPLDGIFLAAAQRSGGIQSLLDEFFSFLHRRTDFYVVDPNPQRPMGFDAGVAERMVLKSLRSLPFKPVPAATSPKLESARTSSGGPAVRKTAATSSVSKIPEECPAIGVLPTDAASSGPPAKADTKLQLTDAGKQIPIGNGGIGPNYWWTQTLTEATVYVDVPPGTHSKDVAWTVTSSTVTLALKARPEAPLLSGELGGSIRASECMWTLEDGSTLVLTFEKGVHTWWASVLKGHPEIDTQRVDSTMKVEDYDPETQAAIRKIMFDQQQKRKGLPTSEELEMQALMEKAAMVDGSPFK